MPLPFRDYPYYAELFRHERMPLAYVDLDMLGQNIQDLLLRAKGKKIRIASKSIRCRAIIDRILEEHPDFYGIMCFTAEEAVYLARQGYGNLLVGYPTVNAGQLKEVASLNEKGKSICLMVDSLEHLPPIEKAAEAHNMQIRLCIDIDMSTDFPGLHFGVWRSSIIKAEQAVKLARAIIDSPKLQLSGIMGYEAQIAGLGDSASTNPLKNLAVRQLKKRSVKELAKRRAEVVRKIEDLGVKLDFVNGGGTGSLETTSQEDAVSEVTIGSGFYSSHLFDHYDAFKHQPAAAFAVEIVRQPKKNMFTCLGGGYIASGVTGKDKQPLPHMPTDIELDDNEGTGEVQTPFKYYGQIPLKLGDPIFFRHSKAGELCERFNELYLISEGKIVDKVPTYRGEGKAFL